MSCDRNQDQGKFQRENKFVYDKLPSCQKRKALGESDLGITEKTDKIKPEVKIEPGSAMINEAVTQKKPKCFGRQHT